ncbi:MAG: ATP synthase F1 subunit epsilon [Candidatus Caldatribacterium sp.]|nr:ATP synthase F1 subunit epsilon [Candidatus Caldatribacterium sp.]
MTLVIITPEREITIPEVRSLIFECPDGKRGVLPGHARALFELPIGVLYCRKENGEELYFALGGGVAEVTPEKVTVLVHSAEEAHEIDVARAQEAARRAEIRLREKAANVDFARAQMALLRSLARLRAAAHLSRESKKATRG